MNKPIYQFRKLEKSVETIKLEHPKASEPLKSAPDDELTALIDRIIQAYPKDCSKVAESLTRRDATLLIHAFQRRLPPDHHAAVAAVLALRTLPRQLTQAWFILRNHPDLGPLKVAMRSIASAIPRDQVAKDEVLQRLKSIWQSDDVDKSLLLGIDQSNKTITNWCTTAWPQELKIDLTSPLYQRLKAVALAYGSSALLHRHEVGELSDWFSYVPESLFDDAAANYIQQLDQSEWDLGIIEKCVDRYGLPAAGGKFWSRVSDDKRLAIQRLIAGRLIAEFFKDTNDPLGRFQFWKGYVDQLISIAYPSNRERVLLHFGSVLVVEFRDIGNAGYVYSEEHRVKIERAVTSFHSNSACKIPAITLHRIIHNRNWQQNTRDALHRVLT